MEVKINREIRDYTEAVFFGMSLRQCICSAFACLVAVALYFSLNAYLGIEELSWICILGAAPFAAIGFVRWHSMSAEQIVVAWLKSEVLTPKCLLSQPENLYFDTLKHATERKSVLFSFKLPGFIKKPNAKKDSSQSSVAKRVIACIEKRYINILESLYEQAHGKRDAHDKNDR